MIKGNSRFVSGPFDPLDEQSFDSSGADTGSFASAAPNLASLIFSQAGDGLDEIGTLATIPNGAENEVVFISGVTSSARLAGTAYWTWDGDNPATYSSTHASKWGNTTLATNGTSGGNVTYWFDASSNWTTTEQNALAAALALWSAEANITFSLATNASSANQTFYRGAAGSKNAFEHFDSVSYSTVGSGTDGQSITSRIVIDTSQPFWHVGTSFDDAGGYGWQTIVHEEGHMLGLGHGGPYNGNVASSTQQFSNYDTRLWTLMSYIDPNDTNAKYFNSYPVTGTAWGYNSQGYMYEPTTPMILDILAVQRIYGAPTSGPLVSGGQTFGFNTNISGAVRQFFDFTNDQHPVVTIWDGGVGNTLDLSGFSSKSTINLNPGTFSSANGMVNNIAIAMDTVIETAIGGAGSDTIYGSSANNFLRGNGGDDTIDGGDGTDTAIFSQTRAAYTLTALTGNGVRVSGPDGTDTLTNVERLAFSDQTINWPPGGGSTDDFADSLTDSTAPFGLVAVNGSSTGTLETVGDRDWFRVQLVAGTSYTIDLQGAPSGNGTLANPFLHLHGSSGTLLAENDDVAGNNHDSRLVYTATANGTFYLDAGSSGDSLTGTYRLSLNVSAAIDDFRDSLSDSTAPFGQVAVNASSSGTLETTGDRDWFQVQLTAGTTYLINLQGQQAGQGTLEDPYLRLHDSGGALLAESDDIDLGVNRDSQLTYSISTTGTYYLEAGAFDDDYTGTYHVSVAATQSADDFRDSLTDTTAPFGQLVVNGTTIGSLEVVGDRDWFQVQLAAGTYLINLQGQHAGGGTLEDPYLRVHDAVGTLIAENDDIVLGIDRDSQLSLVVGSAGTYYLEAGAYIDNYSGTYRISVSASVNHAPSGTDKTITANEDVAYALTTADFGFTDVDGNSLAAVKISTLPTAGTLRDHGSAVSTGQFVSVSDISSGQLVFSPAANANGTNYASLTFQVRDDGGTANGGVDLDPTANTLTFNVVAFNDPPTDISASTLLVNEFAANGTAVGVVTAQDVDDSVFTYTLLNDAGGRFAINNSGQVTVTNGLLLDFEQNASHTIIVRATDAGNLFVDKTFVVAIGDVNPESVNGNGADNIFVGGSLDDTLDGAGGSDTLDGGSGNDTLIGGTGIDIMRGGPGSDNYFVDNAGDVVSENINEGNDTVYSTANFVLSANIETLVLQGAADLQGYGNAQANTIYGNGGNNLIDGQGGADGMIGGLGNDSYFVDNSGDLISENLNEGNDTVYATANYQLSPNIETLILQGAADLRGTGNAQANTIFGNTGNNVLDGQGGADAMIGGTGNDTYFVDNTGDGVFENANDGSDTVNSTISYTLGANVENLNLVGIGNLNGSGNSQANSITGNAGDNTIDGQGGVDTMNGGAGNDSYFVDNPNDIVSENLNEGSDTVYSTANFVLSVNIETLVLQGAADLTGTGNAQANTIYGNSGNNTIDGGGGADAMIGGAGNDNYFVDNSSDAVAENVNEGNDTVYSTASFVLSANIETLVLQGTADLTGTGNAQANTIYGNSGNNTINGGGGSDAMIGGSGNDNYFVDNVGDAVAENVNEGNDTVYATANFALSANIETLVLQGGADLQGYGNAQANTIYGNAGNNLLDGQGGTDTMIGGLGNDAYFVDNPGDLISENLNEGNDTVYAAVNFTLPTNVEFLVLQGGVGLFGAGNGLNNAIYGTASNDVLNGGSGGDVMYGGAGNDSYFVDSVNDLVIENANEGLDTVYSTVNFTLSANVEFLVLQGSVGLFGAGNGLNNAIYGTTGNDVLSGGSGGDVMYGGAGNDSYFVDNASDQVIENANEGSDTVYASISFALTANIEYLVLQGSTGLQGYGNSSNNVIYGTSGDDLLNGNTGADTMYGGAGNDAYFVDNSSDAAIENANEGIDNVYASANFHLGANIENLILQGSVGLQGVGNSSNNAILGTTGNDVLDGSSGVDALQGNAGNDTFVFHTGEANGDTIVDFAGNGASAGDSFQFVGFGTAGQGATFTEVSATNQWQIHSGLDLHNEFITLSNSAPVHVSDFAFI